MGSKPPAPWGGTTRFRYGMSNAHRCLVLSCGGPGQAMDRAHRLGQRRTVNVYRLLVRGTLEEHIMGLQRFKLDVAGTAALYQPRHLTPLTS